MMGPGLFSSINIGTYQFGLLLVRSF
jgi:hypothetical protein